MKIFYFAHSYYPSIGGAETYIKNLAEGMAKKKHKVFVFTPFQDKNRIKILNGVRIIQLRGYGRKKFYQIMTD